MKAKFTLFIILFAILVNQSFPFGIPFKKEMFEKRRNAFMDKMEGGIALYIGSEEVTRNGNISNEFRQGSDFYYLTGYEAPGAVLLLVKGEENKSVLLIEKMNVFVEFYSGLQPSLEDIKNKYGMDEVYYTEEFDEIFGKHKKGKEKIYYSFNNETYDEKIKKLYNTRFVKPPSEIINPDPILHDMRLFKSPEEIELLQRAIDITCDAQIAAYKAAKPGMNESELEAVIEYTFRKNGSPRNGFQSIIGAGKNSCVLHYHENNQTIEDWGTIVMDIGAEYGYYSADVTRTIPADGTFNKEQKEIYNIVLEAQQKAIDITKPGVSISDINDVTVNVIKNGLYKLGLITDTTSAWQIKLWYFHFSSHWLGLDTHDAGDYKRFTGGRILEPGMVFTIEPGIYIGEDYFDLAKKMPPSFISHDEIEKFYNDIKPAFEKYKNIGVRIEDDILVTENGYRNLSIKAPRKIEEIEKLMNSDR